MRKSAILKTIYSFILLSMLFPSVLSGLNAAEYSRGESKIDSSLSDQSTKQYAQPGQILITQIKTNSPTLEIDSAGWFRNLYYYSITRMGYVDIPFTYVVDREGNIYSGRDGGATVSPELENDQGGVVIGFLSNSSDVPQVAADSIRGLVTQMSYKYGISKKSTKPVVLKVEKNENGRSRSTYTEINNTFATNINSLMANVTYSDKEHLKYKAEVTEIRYEKKVKAGEKLSVEVMIKNANDFPWFTDKDFIYLSTGDGKDSKFAVNGVWKSFSKPTEISKKTVIPGEIVSLKFDMQAALLPGKHTQSFKLLKLPNTALDGSSFKVDFEITKGDFKLVQVVRTPAGVLNVRGCPSGNCKAVATLTEGQVVVMVEKTVTGWYRIRYADKKEGWVYAPYIKEL